MMDQYLNKYLNKRWSLRNLSDEDFNVILPILAQELCVYNYFPSYSDDILRNDWAKLREWTKNSNSNIINSTSRIGMKLCEHFFPNFYFIKNKHGVSFHSSWNQENLEKCLRWNRKYHSTPYLSEIKRGIYFCCGLTKNTMYRPQLAKLLCTKYKASIVLDPCAGWGGRMLGVVASGSKYIAFEPNTETYHNLQSLARFLKIESQVTLICDDAMNMDMHNIPMVDMILTSPPYFNLEVYTYEPTQSITKCPTYESWRETFLFPLIEKCLNHLSPSGVSCWNVAKLGKYNMPADVELIHKRHTFLLKESLCVTSSKRQMLRKNTKTQKSFDITNVYGKFINDENGELS